jgi:hypothetical protein
MDEDRQTDDDYDARCCFYSVDSVSSNLQKDDVQIALFHHNIRSFNKNYDELSVLLNRFKFTMDVIVLTETWFSPLMCFEIEGFIGHHSFRSKRRGGGVSIYVRDYFPVTSIATLLFNDDVLECCAVKVSLSSTTSLNVVGIYRPPDPTKLESFNTVLSGTILNFFRPADKVVITGDFNIDLLEPDNFAHSLSDIFNAHYFIPLVTKPTHVTGLRASLIDHVWTNILSSVSSGVIDVDITDHFPIFSIFDLPSRREPIKRSFVTTLLVVLFFYKQKLYIF